MTLLTSPTRRSLAAALALTLALPAAALAQDIPEADTWPTADELRRELQAIGYEFEFDATNMAASPEWRADLPVIWALTEPAVVDDAMPQGDDYETLILRIVDIDGQPVQMLFGATSVDQAEGELETINTVLMEVAARLPEDAGLDTAVWFMSNVWMNGVGQEVTTSPCMVAEFDGGATVVWRGSDGDQAESFFGTITHFEGQSAEVEQCRALQEGAIEDPADPPPDESAEPVATVDYSVLPGEAVALIEAGEHTIIDVRTPEEYEAAHIVGAINIHVEEPSFAERIAELDPDAPYLLYCRSGRRSDLAAQLMAGAGFTDLTDAAGLADLARAGAPVE